MTHNADTHKKCSKCKEVKERGEFGKNRREKDGLAYRCKECKRKTYSKWCSENKDKIKESGARWRAKNKDKIKIKSTRYIAENEDKIKASKLKWRRKNEDKIREYQSRWRRENKDEVRGKGTIRLREWRAEKIKTKNSFAFLNTIGKVAK